MMPSAATPSLEAESGARVGRIALVVAFLLGAALPFQWHLHTPVGMVNFCAADLLILPAALLLSRQWLHARGLGWWVFALALVNLIAWAGSLSLLPYDTFLRELSKIGTCYAFALVGYALGSRLRTRRALVAGVLTSALPVSVVAIQSFFTRVPLSFIPDGRVSGPFTDPNAFACYLAMMVALVMTLRVDVVAIPLFLGAGLLTFSRSGFVGIVTSVLLGLTHARVPRYIPTLLVGVLGGVLIWNNIWGHSVNLRVMEYQSSLEGRKELWARGLDVAARHPLIGIGRGNWEAVSGSHTIPHNTLLSVAADVGLIGLLVFLVPLLVWLVKGLRRRDTRAWATTLLVSLLAGLAVSLDNFRPFWLFTGVLVACLTTADRAPAVLAPGPAARSAAVRL